MNLAIHIQHTAERKHWTKILLKILNNDATEVYVGEKKSLWEDAKKVLSHRPSHTHVLVMQDDILPCQDFIPTVEQIINLLPNQPITFFTNNPAADVAVMQDKRWVTLSVWLMAQAYVLPVEIIDDMVAWIDEYVKEDVRFDDERMAMYFYYHKIPVYATVPSLVEHLGWNSTTLSTYTDKARKNIFKPENRMARQYIGFENSGLDIDWTIGLADPVHNNDGSDSMFCQNFKRLKNI